MPRSLSGLSRERSTVGPAFVLALAVTFVVAFVLAADSRRPPPTAIPRW